MGSEHLYRYPYKLSGEQRQRVALLRAILLKPKLVILDEPASSLDDSVQAQILELLKGLLKLYNLTHMSISHDIAVVKYMSDRMAVMYLGKVVELGDSNSLFASPLHPYSVMLISSVPIPDPEAAGSRQRVRPHGKPPCPMNPPSGRRFHPRCPHFVDVCRTEEPPLAEMSSGRRVACWLYVKR